MAKKVKLILNPLANLGSAWKMAAKLRPIVNEFGDADWAGTVYPTHASELAHQAGLDGYDLVVAMGGDGTVHEVVNGLMELPPDKRPLLGIVPLGSGNDFAYSLGIAEKAEDAMRQVFTGSPRPVDIGVFEDEHGNSQYWTNAVGVGFDAIVTIHSRSMPFLHGYPVYFASVLKTIAFNYFPFKITVTQDGQVWQQESVLMILCNGKREGGGFHVAPDSSPFDGIFSYLSLKRINRLQMLNTLVHFLRGTQFSLPYVQPGEFKQISLEADRPLVIHIDGEIVAGLNSQIRSFKASIVPAALQAVV